jgi:hypothetical protein
MDSDPDAERLASNAAAEAGPRCCAIFRVLCLLRRYDPSALRVLRSVPVPGEAELRGFIPNAHWPSDHLAVVYDLAWRGVDQGE